MLTTQVAPEEREAWYERQLRSGVQVVIAHPRLVQTGLDLLAMSRHLLLRDGLFHLHLAAGQPTFVEDWAAE